MGEGVGDALLRESKEEAGWELTREQFVTDHSDWFYHSAEKKFYRSLQLFWLADGKKVHEPTEPEIEAVQFVPLNRIDELPLGPSTAAALIAAVDLINMQYSHDCACGGHGGCGGECGGACSC